MEDDATLVTREQYVEMLIDASFKDAAEIESGFMGWCEQRVPVWRNQGYDEMWVRQRIEMAQITRGLHRKLKEQGLTIWRSVMSFTRHTPIIQNSMTLRWNANVSTLAYEKFCCWSGQPKPSPDSVFYEQPDSVRVVRDLSTVEELEVALAMSRYTLQFFGVPEKLTQDQISLLMETYGKQLRATFISKHRYQPEDSNTPYVPVTIDGPQDHDAYYAKEYP